MAESMAAVLAVLEQVSALIRSLDDEAALELVEGRLVLAVERRVGPPVASGDVSDERPSGPPARQSVPWKSGRNAEVGPSATAGRVDIVVVRRRLDEMGSRDEAREFLAGVASNKKALQQLGRDLGVRVSLSLRRDDMIDAIVNSAVGVRLDQEGIRKRLASS
ncbi:hypothetical protein I6A60_02405 [Frankia sp. AgB1.9]|uniref:hypothetical protein n=1 Tax=unclassified Frankia TaxID=2632575 RepID=UPI0019340F20|nr:MULTISPECIES: hypothetical protein [unclassified Frankia]MBL7488916.1 hypothetical protein [Frankia sp. AgW1.1]MBL7546737.1 hypothetical protein [Frankia sp. AgB1.9]MBL7621831.1 hypothetical protein [Frankia sp. AgB1.8]